MAQKILARAAGRASVDVGEIVTCAVDLAMFHDSSGPRRLAPMLERLGARLEPRPGRAGARSLRTRRRRRSRRIVRITRDWAAETGLKHFYDSQGICHVVLPERGHLRPGMFCIGGDSHSPTGGAFGAYMFGVGSTEMLGAVVTGEIWVRVPRTIRYRFDNRLPDGVTAKDMMLMLIGRFGMAGADYQAIEYAGTAVEHLPMAERMTLSNMGAEIGAQAAMVAADATTHAWLPESRCPRPEINLAAGHGDDGAELTEARLRCPPVVAAVAWPHSPANARTIEDCESQRIDVAYLGACTGAKLVDLRAAAQVLRHRRADPSVALLVAPASVRELDTARSEGTLQVLLDAGATLLPSACGACAGYGRSIPAGARVVSSTARNFQGRMGADDARVWLASPYTVAASAVAGHLADPRPMLAGRPA
ncbi:MAG: aconitase/3-isopropylmalate dehydratase large subunit family protein [Burkholderiaceae bacterium]